MACHAEEVRTFTEKFIYQSTPTAWKTTARAEAC